MKAKIWLAMAAFLPAMGGLAQADTITVCWDGGGDYTTIQAGIDAAVNGDEVVVCEGTYTGPGNRDLDFSNGLPEGQTRAITVRSTDPNKLDVVATTIIDCNGTESNPHRGFYFHSGEGPNSVVAGFTIKNGYATTDGGGIYCYKGSPTVTNCTISDNSAYSGGGIYWNDCSPTITNCTISENTADEHKGWGGGIGCLNIVQEWVPIITNCTIRDNAAFCGGGIGCPPPTGLPRSINIINCIITANRASDAGGGIFCDYYMATIANCTISGNSAENGGGGILGADYGTVTNCILWDNLPEQINSYSPPPVTYSDVQGGWPDQGNINADPCFVDAANDDYHLKSAGWRWDTQRQVWTWDEVTSPCIDTGNPGSDLGDELLSVPDDPDNEWGENLRINMGAYGGTAQASMAPPGWALLADLNNDAIVNLVDLARQMQDWLMIEDEQPGDLNRDGVVNGIDVLILVEDWLKRKPFVVTITKPEDGADFSCNETIEIEADAWCVGGSVVKAEFFANENKIGEDNDGSDGWKTNWEGPHTFGIYNLSAKATNDNGATATSLAVAITVFCGP